MGNPSVRVDILQQVDGLENAAAFSHHLRVDWHGVAVNLIAKEDLVIAERAAGRPQDLVDAENLEGTTGAAEF